MKKKRMENKMQDGFDTRFEKWFLDRFGKDYRDTYFMGDMYDFIASEISKAREEGRREGFIFGYGKGEHSMSEFLEHKWDIPHSSRISAIPDEEIDKALESLTKLTTK